MNYQWSTKNERSYDKTTDEVETIGNVIGVGRTETINLSRGTRDGRGE